MKLANNFLSATAMVATSEAVVMGVKSGLDPQVMIDVINSGSGMNTASRDKFPRAVLPRSFDFGFTTGLMVKDVAWRGGDALARDVDGGRRSGRPALGGRDPRHGREVRLHLRDQADEQAAGVVVGGAKERACQVKCASGPNRCCRRQIATADAMTP